MINRNANKTMYHDLGRIITVSFAAGIEADIRRQEIRKERALALIKRRKEWEAKQLAIQS